MINVKYKSYQFEIDEHQFELNGIFTSEKLSDNLVSSYGLERGKSDTWDVWFLTESDYLMFKLKYGV